MGSAGIALEAAREPDALVLGLELEKQVADLSGIDRLARFQRRFESADEGGVETGPQGELRALPLPGWIDPGKGPVVQLEAEVEGQLQVVVAERVGNDRDQLVRRRDPLGKGIPRGSREEVGG